MLLQFTDAETGGPIWVNPKQVSVIFSGVNPEGKTVTMINLLNGNVATYEEILNVVGRIQGEINNG